MNIEKIENINGAINLVKSLELPFAFIKKYSDKVYLGKTPEKIDEEDFEKELVEARFFSEKEEIRILRINGEFLCSKRSDNGDECIETKYNIASKNLGKTITVKRYFRYDEDGQASLSEPRLCGWERR